MDVATEGLQFERVRNAEMITRSKNDIRPAAEDCQSQG